MFFGGMGGPSRSSTDTKLYDILKVKKNAQPQEIKKSYQKLAREFHPDKNSDPEVVDKFKEISYAYEVLMDERKRQIYDQVGIEGLQGGGGGGGHSDHEDLLAQMFGGGGMGGGMGGMGGLFGGMGGGMGGGRRRQPQRAQHTVHPLKISLEEMYTGKTAKLQISRNIVCSSCKGVGGKQGSEVTCKGCKGHGIRLITKQIGPGMIQQMQQTCPECRGEGRSIADKDKCTKCKGARTTSETKVLQVAIPPGSVHEQNIRLQGEGDQTPGASASDIIIVLDQKDHETFKRQGSDLHMTHTVSLQEALTGTSMVIKHVDGTSKVINVPSGDILSPECTRCVRGLGMPSKRDQSILGDLYIKFDVSVADTYDEKTIAALAKLLPNTDDTKSVAPPSTAHVDECVLQPFEERHFRHGKSGPHGATCEDSDEDMPSGMGGGGQRVQCAHQ